ncbi:hypothetical protein [Streptomyces sp. NPDC006551]|uniref:hypothetical protein n=1 Tax=Streptomyces sp. NPDC006551 TaxID=3157178 RepID=UPI0033B13705
MSTETLTRFLCDAPRCHTNGIGHDNITPPDGWTKLKSTAHIPVTKISPYPARRRRGELSYSERCYGSFSLHLCPEHPDAFAGHQPITNGYGYNASVEVSCSCGALRGRAPAATMVSRYPSHAPESTWFHHLPVELRWYLWRGQRQWATRIRSHGIEHIQQYRNEQQARDIGLSSAYSTPELVYRDAEGEPWTVAPEAAAAL